MRFPCATYLVVGFQHRLDAERFLADLRERLALFGLEWQAGKTRIIEFGRFAASSRNRRGEGKPETFDFLGFTPICGQTRSGTFTVIRKTMRTRRQAKLQEIRAELRRRMHEPVPQVGAYLRSVVAGHVRYYGVPMNSHSLSAFRREVSRLWWKALNRRSQKRSITWPRMGRLVERWLPPARICHPYPWVRLGVTT